jgi:hypothetical protein
MNAVRRRWGTLMCKRLAVACLSKKGGVSVEAIMQDVISLVRSHQAVLDDAFDTAPNRFKGSRSETHAMPTAVLIDTSPG